MCHELIAPKGVAASGCGHMLCLACSKELAAHHRRENNTGDVRCPFCRAITVFTENKAMTNALRALPYWSSELVEAPCGCGQCDPVPRLPKHVCPHGVVWCPHCGDKFSRSTLLPHLQRCPLFPVKCLGSCNRMFPRETVAWETYACGCMPETQFAGRCKLGVVLRDTCLAECEAQFTDQQCCEQNGVRFTSQLQTDDNSNWRLQLTMPDELLAALTTQGCFYVRITMNNGVRNGKAHFKTVVKVVPGWQLYSAADDLESGVLLSDLTEASLDVRPLQRMYAIGVELKSVQFPTNFKHLTPLLPRPAEPVLVKVWEFNRKVKQGNRCRMTFPYAVDIMTIDGATKRCVVLLVATAIGDTDTTLRAYAIDELTLEACGEVTDLFDVRWRCTLAAELVYRGRVARKRRMSAI